MKSLLIFAALTLVCAIVIFYNNRISFEIINNSTSDDNLRQMIYKLASINFNIQRGFETSADYWITAMINKQLVGMVGIIIRSETCYIFGVGVHPSYQRRGIARRLMEKSIKFARNNKCNQCELNVSLDVGTVEDRKFEQEQIDSKKIYIWKKYREILVRFYGTLGFHSNQNIYDQDNPIICTQSRNFPMFLRNYDSP